MFGSQVLDVAAGLALVYLLFSLLCSSIREAIARVLNEREKGLVRAIYRLLGEADPSTLPTTNPSAPATPARAERDATTLPVAHAATLNTNGIAKTLLGHSLIRGVAQKDGKLPTYLSSRTFALALLDTLAPSGAAERSVSEVRAVVATLPNEHVKQVLLPLVNNAGDDIVALQRALETRFDDAMDRVSGWYKRKTQLWIGGMALLVAVACNVDSIAIASTLWRDPTIRARVVAEAATRVKNAPPGSTAEAPIDEYDKASKALVTLKLPVGWDHSPRTEDWTRDKVLGLLLTALALLLGAPFWFDVLSRVVNLRSAGPRPTRGDATPTAAPANAAVKQP